VNYELVFDVSRDSFDPSPLCIGLALVLAGIYMWFTRDSVGLFRSRIKTRAGRTLFAGVYLGFAVLATTLIAAVGGYRYWRAERTLRKGEFAVVEGPVEYFHPMPDEGRGVERFTVRGVQFAYSEYIWSPRFNKTASHGGPIREGLWVRIAYFDPGDTKYEILRLEVKR
jgi:hypothetical protein